MCKKCFTLIVLLLAPATSTAQLKDMFRQPKPISYRADRCRYQAQGQRAECNGNVVVTRHDMRITCDDFFANLDRKGRIIKVQCKGNVHIITKNRVAKSDQANYDANNEQLVLAGRARVAQGQSRLAGESIHIDMETGDIRVEGKVRGLLGEDIMGSSQP